MVEHCSYKSSRIHLKRLPTSGERVIVPPGENAGVVDVGDGWCACFKNRGRTTTSLLLNRSRERRLASAAFSATSLRWARPIAALNSLRFGSLDNAKNGRQEIRSLLAGVVAGIAHYGMRLACRPSAAKFRLTTPYALNPLVNAFALGLVRRDQIFFGKPPAWAIRFYMWEQKTGRDGIHGATMASAEFDEAALEKRPTVQVGDPFLRSFSGSVP